MTPSFYSVFEQRVPLCPKCTAEGASNNDSTGPPKKRSRLMDDQANGGSDSEDWRSEWYNKPILKPDITFFGQALDDAFDKCLIEDREEADLLVIIGTSLQVAPVSELLSHIPHRIPQILINRDPVPHVMDRIDLALLGDCDKVIDWIADEMDSSKPRKSLLAGSIPSLC